MPAGFLVGVDRGDLVAMGEGALRALSLYEVERGRVAELMRAAIALPSVTVLDAPLLLRALEIYEVDRLDFAEAYLVACAEATGVGAVISFDRAIDRVTTVRRVEP